MCIIDNDNHEDSATTTTTSNTNDGNDQSKDINYHYGNTLNMDYQDDNDKITNLIYTHVKEMISTFKITIAITTILTKIMIMNIIIHS